MLGARAACALLQCCCWQTLTSLQSPAGWAIQQPHVSQVGYIHVQGLCAGAPAEGMLSSCRPLAARAMLGTSVFEAVVSINPCTWPASQKLPAARHHSSFQGAGNSGQAKLHGHISLDHAGRHISTMTFHSAGRQTALSTSQRLSERLALHFQEVTQPFSPQHRTHFCLCTELRDLHKLF